MQYKFQDGTPMVDSLHHGSVHFFNPQYMKLSIGVQVVMSDRNHFQVSLESSFAGNVCGFCGDMDGDWSNDLTVGPYHQCPDSDVTIGQLVSMRVCRGDYSIYFRVGINVSR